MHHPILFAAVRRTILPASLLVFGCGALGAGYEPAAADPYGQQIHSASDAGELAIGHIKVPEKFKVELWAAEPMVANPVCMRVDNHDRVYLVETFRRPSGILDIRHHMDWLTDDLSCRTVQDRVDLLRRKMGPNVRKMARDDDRVVLLEDTTGSGKADKSTVFASGFNSIESGIGAGVLPFHGSVYFADVPALYLLKDTKGDGAADYRKELSTGYGVHISFDGHDLHGLVVGPDHKLYFSVGDRGANVKAVDGSAVYLPDMGGVFRCNLDGTHLELFAKGLRNPQQLCFDNNGNLMTGDNNPDYGDPARWVYVVQGGDSGWRIGYQEAKLPRGGGPWMAEQLYQTADKLVDAAYILPPVAHLGAGPSGVQHYPGTGLPEQYNDHFFMVDFRGGSAKSVIHSFALKPRGASYEVVDHQNFVKGLLVTDIDFSLRGGLYACDWTEGWNNPDKGRIYRIFDPVAAADPLVAETRKLLGEGFEKRTNAELVKLLSHRDHRVRQEAQFALADRGPAAIALFAGVAAKGDSELARLHAIWGLGEIGEKNAEAFTPLLPLLSDGNAEVRAQSAKVLGEARVAGAFDKLVGLLKDPEPRPRFFAAIALGRLGRPEAVAPLLAMLRENDNRDAHLRHAAVMGLVGSGGDLAMAAKDPSSAARLGVLLAMRRLERPQIAQFLTDSDPHLVSEVAHAINDVPIPAAYPQLAALLDRPDLSEPVLSRAVNAAFRVGTPQSAKALAEFAAKNGSPTWIRVEALRDLGNWAEPSPLDRVMNMYWPLPKRDEEVAREAAGHGIDEILHHSGATKVPEKVLVAAVNLISTLKIKDSAVLFDLVTGPSYGPELRAEALTALVESNDPQLPAAVKIALASKEPRFRQAGIRALAKVPDSAGQLDGFLAKGSIGEQQAALAAMGELPEKSADQTLADGLDKLIAGQWKPELALDLLEAAEKRNEPELSAKIEKYETSLSPTDHLAEYRVALVGGDGQNGRAVFERNDASCVRCHTVHKVGGIVGPVLDGVGARQNREYLLESIVDPNAKIAVGFETAVIKSKDGKTVTGIVKKDTATEVALVDVDGKTIKLNPSDILSRTRGVSAMPEGFGKTLGKRDLRDLVEYLSELKN